MFSSVASYAILPIFGVKYKKKTQVAQNQLQFSLRTKNKMSFNACPPECNGPFADLAATRASVHRGSNHETRDEQRFHSVLQRLRDGDQQSAAPAPRQPAYNQVPHQVWPPPKPRNRGLRMPELPPSTTRAPINSSSYSYPASYSAHASKPYRSGLSTQGPAVPRPPSYGPIAPASRTDKQRVSST